MRSPLPDSPVGWLGLRRAALAISLLWAATALGAIMVFLAQVLFARELGPWQFGLFASSLATVALVTPMAGFGLSQFRLKAYGAEGWAADRWLRPSLRFSMATTSLAVGAVLVWAFTGASNEATRRTLLVLLPVIVGMLALDLIGGKLRLEERYRLLALWQLLMPAGRLAVALVLLMASMPSAIQAALGYCIVAIAVAGLAIPQLRDLARGNLQLQGHGPRVAPTPSAPGPAPLPNAMQLWSKAWPYGVDSLLYPVFFQVSTVLLKYINNDAQAGRYGIALAVMTAIYLLPATIYQKFLLSKLHRWAVHDKKKFWWVYRRGNVAMLLCGLFIGVALVVLAPSLVPIAFGREYQSVVSILMVLALCAPIRFLSTAVGSALLTEDHMRYRVLAMAAATVVAVVLNVLLIPSFDELGAAMATVAAESVLLLAMYYGVRRFTRSETA